MRPLSAAAGLLVLAAVVCFVLGVARGSDGLLWAAVATGLVAGALAAPAVFLPGRSSAQRTEAAST